jgi:lysophospholipase L1-like esterase
MKPAQRRTACVVLSGAVVLLTWAILASAEPLLRQGDRMVFLGDSITQQRIYTRYVMNYFAVRHPDLQITFRNAGVSGDTAPGGIRRLMQDVLAAEPDVVSICFGMNDAGYTTFEEQRYEKYVAAMTLLIAELREAGARVVLLTPGCVDPGRPGGWYDSTSYNPTLMRYAEAVTSLAERKGLPVYDIHRLMLDVQTRAKADDPEFTMIPDSVHPSPPGHLLMAYGLLQALGCDEQASGLVVDAATGAVSADRCEVRELRASDDEIAFVRTDEALPTYWDPEAAVVLAYAPTVEEINRYLFAVSGLREGSWRLTVEDSEVGTFSAEALAAGLNLASLPGPWQKLGREVNERVKDQEEIYLSRRRLQGIVARPWRMPVPLPPEAEPEKLALVAKLDEVLAARDEALYDLVQQRTWEWSLRRAGSR